MAYDINNENKARYILINFKADTTIIDQLNELIKFNDHILRHLIINTKLPQTEPSFMNKDQLNQHHKVMKNNINNIDYKNLGYIKKYISEAGKLIPSRVSGLNASEQRKMNKAIKMQDISLYYLL